MKTIILIQGLPGSGKTTMAGLIQSQLVNAAWVNADYVRKFINRDLGFSVEDRIEQSIRMAGIADLTLNYGANQYCIVDFVCPTVDTRMAFFKNVHYPVINIWMNTITPDQSRFQDTRSLYERPNDSDVGFTVSGYRTDIELDRLSREFVFAIRNLDKTTSGDVYTNGHDSYHVQD